LGPTRNLTSFRTLTKGVIYVSLSSSIAHGGGVLDQEDAVSALLSLAGWVNTVEEDVD